MTQSPARLALAAAALTLLALPALPRSQANGPNVDVHRYSVRYSPGFLSTDTGRKVLRQEIVHAARIVCRSSRETYELYEAVQYGSCVREATDRAMAEVEARRR
jgi:UrcA family protein